MMLPFDEMRLYFSNHDNSAMVNIEESKTEHADLTNT